MTTVALRFATSKIGINERGFEAREWLPSVGECQWFLQFEEGIPFA